MGGPRKWPNQQEVVDGVTPVEEVSQDPDLFTGDDVDTDLEMEDPADGDE
jgi:hypothetical protein